MLMKKHCTAPEPQNEAIGLLLAIATRIAKKFLTKNKLIRIIIEGLS